MTREAKLKAAADLIQSAAQLLQRGEMREAAQQIEEAGQAWESVPEDEDKKRLAVGAAIKEGKAQIAMQGSSLDDAQFYLEESLVLHQREKAAGGSPNPLQMAASCLNLSTIAHKLGDNLKALDLNTRAQDLLRNESAPPCRVFYATSFEARATLLGLLGRLDEALAAFDAGAEAAARLVAEDVPGGKQLRTEMLVHSARGRARTGRPREAALLVEEAAALAWERFEASQGQDREAISHFVAAQMNLLGFAETLGEFGRAEDALFKVLRLVGPDPRVLERGKKFYEALRLMDDAKLDAGNLPRDEVEESYQQVLAIAQRAAQAPRA
ncbi:MAG: DUF6483 family protein [Myxococcota bacterium]